MTQEEINWRRENDADEQLNCVSRWSDYEDYDYVYECKSMETLIELYLFVNFEIGVEFVSGVQELIDEECEDGDTTTLDKALAWDKAHGTNFWYNPNDNN